jgi:hypothetical protein
MSKPFWDAFREGLACPARLYASRRDENRKAVGRIDAAWKKIGGYLYDSIDSMAGNVRDRRRDKRVK